MNKLQKIISKIIEVESDLFEKAGSHKYIRREGTPGHYKYIYSEKGSKKISEEENKVIKEKKLVREYDDQLLNILQEKFDEGNWYKKIIDEEIAERKKIKDGYKELSYSTSHEVSNFYDKEAALTKKYLSYNHSIKKSVASYISYSYEALRKFHSNRSAYVVNSKKESLEIREKESQDLSQFANDMPLSENLVLNRRVSLVGESKKGVKDFFENLKEGDIYEDKSFSSTSLIKLSQFGDFDIEILAKKGSRVTNIGNYSEFEYLIDKDSKFKVLRKTKSGMIVELL